MIEGTELDLFERSLRLATERHRGSELDDVLAELGWLDALSVDPRNAISLLFELQGRANTTSSAIERVMASPLGIGADDAAVLPALGAWEPPAVVQGGRVSVRGVAVSSLTRRGRTFAAAAGEDPATVVLVAMDTSALHLRQVEGIDPGFGLIEVTADAVPTLSQAEIPAAHWTLAVALAQVAVGYETAGAARTMLDLAREHAVNRIQFGRPIAMFQAVRHRLAESLVAIEGAEALLGAAWDGAPATPGSASDGARASAVGDPFPELASMAKSVSGRAARTAARHCQQVLAGIGFTAEHPFHHHLRRVLLLDQLFGSSRRLTEAFGQEILRAGRLPALLEL